MKKANLFLLIVFLFLYVPFSIQAQVPSLISYQGTLTDDNGEPVSDGTYTMSFKLYDSETGTTTVWAEDQSVTVVNGIFNVLLGSEEEFDIEFDEPYWLGISVEEGLEMSPRVQLSSSPYSLKAKSVEDEAITGSKINQMDASVDDILTWSGSVWEPQSPPTLSESDPTWSGDANSTGDIGRTGNVGIGTINPNRILDVIGEADFTPKDDGLGSHYPLSIFSADRGKFTFLKTLNSGDFYIDSHGQLVLDAADNIILSPHSSNQVKINGDLDISGSLSKSSGSFKIDHPLDPENKWLIHSFVESPDMMNIYNGSVTLDEQGEAWVELPEYFEELNKDFRYQLTPIGAPGPELYIAREVSNNRFQIAGGSTGMKVSWQVTGVRNDPYARQNRIQVEVDKSDEERGKYMHPESYGVSEESSINASSLSKLDE